MAENALALAIKPPEPINTDMSKLFGTIANLQLSGAHAGLYSLQAAQEARKLHGMNVYARTGDTEAALRAGADPATMQTAQEMHYKQSVRDRNQGYDTADTERLAKTGETQVSTAQKVSDLKRDRLTAEASFAQGLPPEQRGLYLSQALSRMSRDGLLDPQEANGLMTLHGHDSDRALDSIIRYGKEGTKNAQDMPFVYPKEAAKQRAETEVAGPKAGAIAQAKVPFETEKLEPGQKIVPKVNVFGGQVPGTVHGAAPALPGGFSPTPIGQQPPAAAAAPAMKTGLEGISLEEKARLEATGKETAADFAASRKAYQANGNLMGRLDTIDHEINTLGPSWMGAAGDRRANAAKAWNSALDFAGIKGKHIDPNKVATWEDFNKQTTRAGMELIKSNFGGSREAASIIQMGRTAVPSVEQSYLGAKYVTATIRAATRREMELHEYKAQLLGEGKSTTGADAQFNKDHPPKDYAFYGIADVIPARAISILLADPKVAAQFDKNFGEGLGEFVLSSPAAAGIRAKASQ